MTETRGMSSKMCSKDGRIEAAPGSVDALNLEPDHIYLEGGKVAGTSVSNRSSFSESRKKIAGDFLHLSAEQYHHAHERALIADSHLTRAVDLAFTYGLSADEIEAIIGMNCATFEPLDEVVSGVV